MKAYILNDKDFADLQTRIDRDPQHGYQGGSSKVITEKDRHIYEEAHRFYNYQVRRWIDLVTA
jgi:hypothetical protein